MWVVILDCYACHVCALQSSSALPALGDRTMAAVKLASLASQLLEAKQHAAKIAAEKEGLTSESGGEQFPKEKSLNLWHM
jgi:hypothetical protein